MIDWPQLILELRSKGWTYQMIGQFCGVSREKIRNLTRIGPEPRWSVGERLVRLHRKVSGSTTPLLGEDRTEGIMVGLIEASKPLRGYPSQMAKAATAVERRLNERVA